MHSLTALLSNLTAKTILQHLCKDRDFFLHFNRIETNLQKGYKDRDQNAYLLYPNDKHTLIKNSYHNTTAVQYHVFHSK